MSVLKEAMISKQRERDISQGQADKLQDHSFFAIKQRLAHGTFWNLIGSVVFRLSRFIGNVISARILGQVGFGEFGVIQRTLDAAINFGSLGVGMTTTKYVAELRDQDPQRTGRIISLTYILSWVSGGILAFGFVWGGPWLASHAINAPHLSGELKLAGLLVLISAVYRLQNGVLVGLQSFRSLSRITCWEGFLSLLFIAILVWLAGIWGAILALIIAALIRAMMCYQVLGREYRKYSIQLDFKRAWQENQVLWQFSMPAFLASNLTTGVIWLAYTFLANQPGGYAQLGLFNAAMQFQLLILFLHVIMMEVSVSLLTELYGEGKYDYFARSFNGYLKLNWKLAVAVGFVTLGISPLLMKIYGSQFQEGQQILGLVIGFTVVMMVWNINGQPFYSSGRMWHSLSIQVCWGVALLISGKILVPHYQAPGLAISFLIAYSVAFVIQYFFLRHIFGAVLTNGCTIPLLWTIVLITFSFIQYKYSYNYIYFIQFFVGSFIAMKLGREHYPFLKELILHYYNR